MEKYNKVLLFATASPPPDCQRYASPARKTQRYVSNGVIMKFLTAIPALLLIVVGSLAGAFELTAEPGMANLVNSSEDTKSGQRRVSMTLLKTAAGKNWAAAATCGLMDPDNQQNAVLLRVVQDLPADDHLFFVFNYFENAEVKSQKILAKDVKFSEPQTFEIEWDNGNVKVTQGETLVIETPISFTLARFYCGISSGTADFDIKT
ncbi:MAG: hypothetical protein ACRBBW_15775 [Cellvibrionaceae bacterium]